MGELARRTQARLERETQSKLGEIQRQTRVDRAQIESRETTAAFEVAVRLNNGGILAHQTQQTLTSLHTTAARSSDPDLEMGLRRVATTYELGANQLVYGYMTRPRWS